MIHLKKRIWLAAAGTALVLGYTGWKNRHLFTVHDVTTGESAAYPRLRSRVYYGEPAAALQAIEQAVKALPRWQELRLDSANLALDAETGRSLAGSSFLSVYVVPFGHGQVRVIIHCWSRVKLGDWGRNASYIRELQEGIDKRLTQDAAISACYNNGHE